MFKPDLLAASERTTDYQRCFMWLHRFLNIDAWGRDTVSNPSGSQAVVHVIGRDTDPPTPEERKHFFKSAQQNKEDPWEDDEIIDSIYWDDEHPHMVRQATAYWVEPDLCTVIEHAAAYLPKTYRLTAQGVPQESGCVTLGESLLLDLGDPENELEREDLPRWGLTPADAPPLPEENLGRLVAIHWHRATNGVVLETITYSEGSKDQRYNPTGEMIERWALTWREMSEHPVGLWLCAFWLFIHQKLPALSTTWAPRSMRRHELKEAPELHRATFCTLRKRSAREHAETSDVNWTHRWMVSGHWREQWFPSLDTHQTIWIAPHVKGPDELPLVHKDRAFMVIR